MKTKRRKILLLCMQVLLPVVPGLWTVLFRPETAALSPRMLVTWMLCLNLLFILIYWRRLGWSRSERLDTALLLVLFCFFPLPGHWLLDGMLDGSLWLQIAFYCMMQAGFYVAIVLGEIVKSELVRQPLGIPAPDSVIFFRRTSSRSRTSHGACGFGKRFCLSVSASGSKTGCAGLRSR